MRWPCQLAIGISGLLLAFGGAACFSPSFQPCAISCGEASGCPEGLVCLADGWCHAQSDEQLCMPGQDGSVDGSVDGPDGSLPDAGGADAPDVDASDVDAGPPVAPTQAGDLVITEIHKNPAATAEDMFGEWFELYNPTDRAFDLLGIRVNDIGQDAFVIDESVIVPPGGRVVLARNGDPLTNGGVEVDFDYGFLVFALANAVDEIQIQNTDALVVIDTVAYDQEFPNTDGRSMTLDPTLENETANNEAASWCDGATPFGEGDFGTPGQPNDACP